MSEDNDQTVAPSREPSLDAGIPIISKSKYIAGLQCQKRLWVEYNKRELIPPVDSHTQVILDQGKEVGVLARRIFPEGVEIDGDYRDFGGLVFRTRKLLASRRPLFEASFQHGAAFARVDILVPAGDDEWDIVEVKSAGEVKDGNIDDVSMQYYTCRGAGLKIRRCFVMHINKSYVRHGEIDPSQLLVAVDVTPEVLERVSTIPGRMSEMQRVIEDPVCPVVDIGPQCTSPHLCPLRDHCWNFLPQENLFKLLPEKLAFAALEQGIVSIRDIHQHYMLTAKQTSLVEATLTGKVQRDETQIAAFLARLHFPLYFLDFETVHPAIPMYDGVRPFQQVPFQFSVHVVRSAGVPPEHHSFLAEGLDDPRPELLRRLRTLLGAEGTILAYYAPFEKGRIKESCSAYPEYAEWSEGLFERIVDLRDLFSSFAWYHPEQWGSTSMKVVLPLLTGLSYDGMEIADGETASMEFRRVTFGEVSEDERRKVRERLEKYCGLDTYGMVAMVEGLGKATIRN